MGGGVVLNVGRRCCARAALAALLVVAGCGGRVPDEQVDAHDSGVGEAASDSAADAGCRDVSTPDGATACITNDECPPDQYCGGTTGCGCRGWCEARITSCTGGEVCGCDDKRYKNFCEAAFAGVRAGACSK